MVQINTWSFTMNQQEDGWPLGLQRLNRSVGVARSLDLSASASFSTLLTSTATSSSFDLDTEETEGATFGSTTHLSRRSFSSSIRASTGVNGGFGTLSPPPQQQSRRKIRKNQTIKKPKNWLCSLCSNPVSDDGDHVRSTAMTKMVPLISLGYLLEEERRNNGKY